MNRGKSKVNVGSNSTNNIEEQLIRPKAVWDKDSLKLFIDGALEQVNKGERNGTSLTKKGWAGLTAYLKAGSGKTYDKQQLKNKWDNLKKEWVSWYTLFKYVTGLGWNHKRNTFNVSDEWWNAREREDPAYGKYHHQGLLYAREMTYLFKDQVATGEYAWNPFCDNSQDDEGGDDEYATGAQNLGRDNSEGSGDSEDPTIGASYGSMGLGNINLNTSQNNNSSRSGEKRKRGGGKGNAKKGKPSNMSQLGQHLDNVASAVSSHSSAVLASKEGSDIGLAMAALHTLPGVEENQAFYSRCCQVFLNPRAMQVFLAIPNPANQLAFLRSMIDNTNYP